MYNAGSLLPLRCYATRAAVRADGSPSFCANGKNGKTAMFDSIST